MNFKGGMAQREKRIDYTHNQQQENDSGNAKDSFGRVVTQIEDSRVCKVMALTPLETSI